MKKLFFVLSFFPLLGLCQLHNYEMYMPSSTDNLVYHKSFYSHSYLKDKKLSEWTIYFAKNEKNYNIRRNGMTFRADTSLPYEQSALLTDYRHSGYDRGHLVPAADMTFDSTALSESFLMSNVAPQTPQFNRGINKVLECIVREWRRQHDSLVVITGCVFKDTIHFQEVTIGRDIPVPEFFYKIIIDIEKFSSIAFVIPNSSKNYNEYYKKEEFNLKSYVYSIDELEALTGIDFLYKLPKRVQNLIEKDVHLEDWYVNGCATQFHLTSNENNENIELSKMAFVMGNSDYYRDSDKLENPKNDANLMYNTFVEMEFDTVILLKDQSHEEMINAISDFQDLSYNYDLNIFYYAGHGIQDPNGNSYLVPISYKGDSLENIAISLQELIYFLSKDKKNKSIVILDACREDYDNRSMSKPDIEDPVNLKLGFSTSFGKEAFDHPELGNSLYTSTLSKNLLTPNMTLSTTFHATWNKVFNATHHKQSPAVYFGQQLEELILLTK